MVQALLIVNIFLPMLYLTYKTKINDEFIIDHEIIFSAGYLYYWIFPMAIGILYELDVIDFFREDQVLNMWYSYYTAVNEESKQMFLFIGVLLYGAFIGGSQFFYVNRNRILPVIFREQKWKYSIMSLVLIPIIVLILWKLLPNLFGGYRLEMDAEVSANRAMLAGLTLVCFSVYLFYVIRNWNFKQTLLSNIFTRYIVLYLICAVGLLSTGGRLYFVTTVVVMLVFYSNYIGEVTLNNFFKIGLALGLFSGLVGVLRLSSLSDFDMVLFAILSNIGAEPILTSISLFTFLESNDIPVLVDPTLSISLLINILPNFLFRDLREMLSLTIFDEYILESPLGALNSFVSFMGYFGILGSMLFLFLIGLCLSYIRNLKKSTYIVIYCMLSGALMFTFFRDAFEISLIKIMVQDSIIIPAVIGGYLNYNK